MNKYKKITKEQIKIEYLDTLDSGAVVAKRLGMSYKTFSRVLSNLGIKAKGRQSKYPQLRDKKWIENEYFNKKKSTRQIAREIGATAGAVHSAVRWLGWELRTSMDAVKLYYPKGRFGPNSPSWKGGRRISKNGYVRIYSVGHPNVSKDGYVMEHRLVMEKKIGRYLKKGELVHHINGKKDDNRIENLELISNQGKHTRSHFERSHRTEVAELEVDRLRKLLIKNGINPDIDK